jgi:hypothetical protein
MIKSELFSLKPKMKKVKQLCTLQTDVATDPRMHTSRTMQYKKPQGTVFAYAKLFIQHIKHSECGGTKKCKYTYSIIVPGRSQIFV